MLQSSKSLWQRKWSHQQEHHSRWRSLSWESLAFQSEQEWQQHVQKSCFQVQWCPNEIVKNSWPKCSKPKLWKMENLSAMQLLLEINYRGSEIWIWWIQTIFLDWRFMKSFWNSKRKVLTLFKTTKLDFTQHAAIIVDFWK